MYFNPSVPTLNPWLSLSFLSHQSLLAAVPTATSGTCTPPSNHLNLPKRESHSTPVKAKRLFTFHPWK